MGSLVLMALPAHAQDNPQGGDDVLTKSATDDDKNVAYSGQQTAVPQDLDRFLKLLEANAKESEGREMIRIGESEEEVSCFN
jgi:hypothetical protein